MTEHRCTFPNCAEPAPVFRAKMERLCRINAELVEILTEVAAKDEAAIAELRTIGFEPFPQTIAFVKKVRDAIRSAEAKE